MTCKTKVAPTEPSLCKNPRAADKLCGVPITEQEEGKQKDTEPPLEMAQVRSVARKRAFETSLKGDSHLTNIVGIKMNQMAARKPPVP